MNTAVREYTPADESSWLRCRVLAFLHTAYFDGVRQAKPEILAPGFALVTTVDDDEVTGIMDARPSCTPICGTNRCCASSSPGSTSVVASRSNPEHSAKSLSRCRAHW